MFINFLLSVLYAIGAPEGLINFVANKTATVPDLLVNKNRKITRGMGHANEILQMDEWAYHDHLSITLKN